MSIEHLANQDFDRAVQRGFWRRVLARLTGEKFELLPYDQVREQVPVRGQHYIGLQTVPIDKIVGSQGRYMDFDRAFLPTQKHTRDRWTNIDKAHYRQIELPPVELFKMGEVYFVKDGNHRISVARERGQQYLEAYVIEVDIPFALTADVDVNSLELKGENAEFMETTHLSELRPEARVETTVPGLYKELLKHIDVHRYYLGEKRQAEVPYEDAVASWYDNVYLPLVELIREQGLLKEFPGSSEADLYLWILEYQGQLAQAYKQSPGESAGMRKKVSRQFVARYPNPAVRKLVHTLRRTDWIDQLTLDQERSEFLEATRINEIRPGAHIETTVPGQYERLREHIAVHRYYMGEERKAEVPYPEAVASWYDNVYMPLVEIIREHNILKQFPNRTETDLYLWIIERQFYLQESYGELMPMTEVAVRYAEDFSQPVVRRLWNAIKKAAGKIL